jgi:hypothetical protein
MAVTINSAAISQVQRSAALTLVTADVFMLANPALPVAGDLLALVPGIELLAWARVEPSNSASDALSEKRPVGDWRNRLGIASILRGGSEVVVPLAVVVV